VLEPYTGYTKETAMPDLGNLIDPVLSLLSKILNLLGGLGLPF
jgi:hypothetical protein